MKRITLAITIAAFCAASLAKLPEPTPEAKAKAELTKAENAYKDKVAAYQLCQSQDAAAKRYLGSTAGKGKRAADTPACVNPGPFVPPEPVPAATAPPQAAVAPAAAVKK